MQVSVQETGALTREMKVILAEDQIAGEVENRLKSMSKRTKIDGFRKGKVPFKVIENRYGKQIRQEVLGDLVQSSYYEALQQEKLTPAGRPKIEPLDTDSGSGLSYTAVFEVMPEVKLVSVDKLAVEKPEFEISDDDYKNMVEVLRKQHVNLEEVSRESKNGDTLEIDFEGLINNEAFEGGTAKEFKLELGQNRFIDGFEDGLIGKKAGEDVSLDLKFPDDYQKTELAGKDVHFNVSVKKVLEPVLPELNDDFFSKFGIKEGGDAAFRKEVEDHMQKEAETATRNQTRDNVMESLLEANPVDLPESLVHEEIHRLEHQFRERMRAYGVDPDTSKDIPTGHEAFEEQAKKRVALQLIVMEVIRQQELKADPAKVRALIEKNSSNYEDPEMVVNWYYQDKQRLAEIEAMVLEDEVVDWVCKNATVSAKLVKFDDLMNNRQTA